MAHIKDIFNNKIEVTNIIDAISQTKTFVDFSINAGENDFYFDEFKLIECVDQWGKTFKSSQKTNSGKSVKSLQYYTDILNKLEKLTPCNH